MPYIVLWYCVEFIAQGDKMVLSTDISVHDHYPLIVAARKKCKTYNHDLVFFSNKLIFAYKLYIGTR